MSTLDDILQLKQRMAESIIGQQQVIERLLLTLLANGNLLLEGLPGLAKTRAVKSLARNLESEFRRIQFTPDLLPSDVTGTEVYYDEGGKGSFQFEPGPIFGNLVRADEINRAPAKVQAALLEAMEERQVTVAGKTHRLPELFMVLATQNPIEQEGTYPLPEAQRDRFLLHIMVRYPSDSDELNVMRIVRGEETEHTAGPATTAVIP
jgi:MoxR-like ATPase